MEENNCAFCLNATKPDICKTCSIQNSKNYIFSNWKPIEEINDNTNQIQTQKPFIYLACPYSHEDKELEEMRFRAVSKIAGQLINAGNIVYSPISHTHPMARENRFPTDYEHWRELDEFYIERCDVFMILKLTGWNLSKGIKSEASKATDLGKPIIYLPAYMDCALVRSTDNVPTSSD